MKRKDIKTKVQELLNNRLLSAPSEVKRIIPPITSKNSIDFYLVMTAKYILVDIMDKQEKKRITNCKNRNIFPFPGLITDSSDMKAAFMIEKGKNLLLSNNTVNNLFSFKLGKDSSIILHNHNQSINIINIGQYRYQVKLAYLITFGKEINQYNFLSFLDGLIAYSINKWRQDDAPPNQK